MRRYTACFFHGKLRPTNLIAFSSPNKAKIGQASKFLRALPAYFSYRILLSFNLAVSLFSMRHMMNRQAISCGRCPLISAIGFCFPSTLPFRYFPMRHMMNRQAISCGRCPLIFCVSNSTGFRSKKYILWRKHPKRSPPS